MTRDAERDHETIGLYADPSVYDILHTPGTAAEVTGFSRMVDRFVRGRARRGAWLEPACGSGRYLRVAAGRGVRTIGFDLSADMAAYTNEWAARAGLQDRVHAFVGDMTDFVDLLPRGVKPGFAFNTINTIRHLPDDAAMLAHFDQMARALQPGGVYVVGISTAAYGCEMPSEDVWTARRGRVHVTQVVNFLPGEADDRVEQVISHIRVETPTHERHDDSTYELRMYSSSQWLDLIAASAMKLVAVVDEEGRDFEPPPSSYGLWVLAPA